MPAPRSLPSDSTLLKWRDEGLTHQQIADRVYDREGVRVTRSAVSVSLHRAGETHKVRYLEQVPWDRIKAVHNQEYPLTMLRSLARRNRGLPISQIQSERLDSWLERLGEEQAVVHYEPQSEHGFYYVPRQPEDGDGYVRKPSRAKGRPSSRAS